MARQRKVKSVKDELVKKSREAILAAVQIYNSPQITFKAESFITLAIIGWTYLYMHTIVAKKCVTGITDMTARRKYSIKQSMVLISIGS